MKGLGLMAVMLTAYFVREVWTLFAFRREVIYPFPFAADQYIHRQTYWSMFLGYTFAVIVAVILWQGLTTHKVFWICVFVVAVAEVIEYLLNYNRPWGRADFGFFEVSMNITNFRYLVLGLAFAYELIKYRWKKSIKE